MTIGRSLPSTSPSESVSLVVTQSKQLPSGVTVSIDSIQDSRCPANAMCIWAGQVEVKVRLSKGTDSQSISLILGPRTQLESAQVTVGTETYKVVLRAVLPYPGTGSNQIPTANVEVTSM